MEFLDAKLAAYAQKHSSEVSYLMQVVDRETWYSKIYPRMISGPMQGKFLEFISQMIQPNCILEIGTFTGYSALALASGLSTDGKLISIDIDDQHLSTARKFIDQSEYKNRIELIHGNALDLIPTLNYTWDLVFIDADKVNYLAYYELALQNLSKQGFILADNVLWSGKVLNQKKDQETQALHEFNTYVQSDHRVENLLLPFRDGLMLIRKKN
jgi:caffeoyl-CoA O-methyltransferase